jgi:hypothetical protein
MTRAEQRIKNRLKAARYRATPAGRAAARAADARYSAANRERIAARIRAYRATEKGAKRCKASTKRYQRKNRATVLALKRARYRAKRIAAGLPVRAAVP